MKKALAKRVADILEKLGVVGVAMALFQDKFDNTWIAATFLVVSCVLTVWERKL